MPVQGLGYIGLDASDLDTWRRFGTDVLAMQVIERGADGLALQATMAKLEAGVAVMRATETKLAPRCQRSAPQRR
jgi:hypothetical protein